MPIYVSSDISQVNETVQSLNNINSDVGEPTGFVNRIDSIVEFDNSTRTFSISPNLPNSVSYNIYCHGKLFVKYETNSIIIDDIEGIWYFYFDENGELKTTQSDIYELHMNVVYISIIYWSSILQTYLYFSEDRHGIIMDYDTHDYLHHSLGARYGDGLILENYTLLGDGTHDSDATISFTDGIIYDEDIEVNIKHNDIPIGLYEQILYPIARLSVLYRIGQYGYWMPNEFTPLPSQFPVMQGTNRIQYNYFNGTDWSVVEASGDNKYIATFIFATTNLQQPIFAMLGQREDDTLQDAMANNTFDSLKIENIPFEEIKVLYRLIYKTNSTYINAPKAVLVDVEDIRGLQGIQISALTVTKHSSLTGLNEDDHSIYVHKDLSRTIRAQHYFSPSTIKAPFILGENAQNQLVVGLDADSIDGKHVDDTKTTSDYLWTANKINTTKENVLTKGNISTTTTGLTIGGDSINSVIGNGVTINIQNSTTSNNGLLTSTDWTIFKNKIHLKNTYTIGCEDCNFLTISSAITWLNSNISGATILLLAPETHLISDTITINYDYPLTIAGLSYPTTFINATTGLTNKPMFVLKSDCDILRCQIYATTLTNYGNNAGENGINIDTDGTYHEFKDMTLYGFNKNIYITSNSEFWVFESVINNAKAKSVEINTASTGTRYRSTAVDYSGSPIGIDLVKANGLYLSIDNDSTELINPSDIFIEYDGLNVSYTDINIKGVTWNNIGKFINGFDFTRTDGRDSNVEILSNIGIENQNPQCSIYLEGNTTLTALTQNVWAKANFINTSYITKKFKIENNRCTFLSSHPRDLSIFISGSVYSTSATQTISIAIIKNGNTAVLFGRNEVTIDTSNRKFTFSSNAYLQAVSENDYFEIWMMNSSNGNDVALSNLTLFIQSIG